MTFDRDPQHAARRLRRPVGGAFVALVLLFGGTAPASAQTDDEAAVLAVIDALFDAMRANDGDGIRSVFVDGASLILTEAPDGSPVTRYIPVEQFASSVGNSTSSLDEPYWDPIVQVRDHLASVWVKYALYVDGEFVRNPKYEGRGFLNTSEISDEIPACESRYTLVFAFVNRALFWVRVLIAFRSLTSWVLRKNTYAEL